MPRPVIYNISITLDGMYAEPDGGLGPFEPGVEEHRLANYLVRDVGDLVMGRVTYDVMEYWDTLDVDDPATAEIEVEFARFWRATPKHVISRGRPTLRDNAVLLEGDVVTAVRAMKAGDGPPIGFGGGADLLATLSEARLIDDYRLLVVPTAIGAGKPLFGSLREPLRLRLIETRPFPSGGVQLRYVPEDHDR